MSFAGTAAFTFIAIVVGYFSDSLPDAALTQLDRACLLKLSQVRWLPRFLSKPLRLWFPQPKRTKSARVAVHPVATEYEARESERKLSRERERRSRGLEKFVLALSDQQLVTGLAILIAGYTNRCTLSLFHFNIIASLAWFSSTTHLSTLAVLRVYLMDRPRVRDWRVVAMVSLLGLLVAAQFVQYSSHLETVVLQCALESFWTIDAYYVVASLIERFLSLALVVLFLLITYSDRIGRLYSDDPDWSVQGWIIGLAVQKFAKRKILTHLERIIIASGNRSKAEQGAALRKLRQRRRFRNYSLHQTRRNKSSSRWLWQLFFLSESISQAFVSDLLTLLFGVVYGVTRVIETRKPGYAQIKGDENVMNFGQIVPLLLLALPILAAGEAYFGMPVSLVA